MTSHTRCAAWLAVGRARLHHLPTTSQVATGTTVTLESRLYRVKVSYSHADIHPVTTQIVVNCKKTLGWQTKSYYNCTWIC